MDAGEIAGFLTSLRAYLDDPAKVKCLLLPTKLSGISGGKKEIYLLASEKQNHRNPPSSLALPEKKGSIA
ncbi:hypothetical protein MRB53_013175 [Persea americana]|uniref:Uncharacterized protein n=1 Tax=Persea americana TaxID=3435 RepID=A0ACC2K797_PERAE|nr:hypothetical protein MRB53_013175 [Persea americana]